MNQFIQLEDHSERRRELLSSLRFQLMHNHQNSYCWTINIPTNYKVQVKDVHPAVINKRLKIIKYDDLTPIQQIYWLKNKYLRHVFSETHFSAFFELTDAGNVHAHCIVNTIYENRDFAVSMAQKWCRQYSIVQHITANCKGAGTRLNYIHTWDKKGLKQWIDYITEDYPENPVQMTPIITDLILNKTDYNI